MIADHADDVRRCDDPIDVGYVAATTATSDNIGAQRFQSLGDLYADPAQTYHEGGGARDLPHHPPVGPDVSTLLGLQSRQVLRAREDAEHRILGERIAVHTRRRRESNAIQLRRREVGCFHLSSASGGHRVHPPQARVVVGHPLEFAGLGVGDSVQNIRRAQHVVKLTLLRRSSHEGRITVEVGGVAHRRIERLIANQLDSGLQSLDDCAVLFAEGSCDGNFQPVDSRGHLDRPPAHRSRANRRLVTGEVKQSYASCQLNDIQHNERSVQGHSRILHTLSVSDRPDEELSCRCGRTPSPTRSTAGRRSRHGVNCTRSACGRGSENPTLEICVRSFTWSKTDHSRSTASP